jgi:hypothetical protein
VRPASIAARATGVIVQILIVATLNWEANSRPDQDATRRPRGDGSTRKTHISEPITSKVAT